MWLRRLPPLLVVISLSHQQQEDSSSSTFTDSRDGAVYGTIDIGNQTWMTENLCYSAQWSWDYGDDPSLSETHGKLYHWSSVEEAVPAGWHLPTDQEWRQLEEGLGMSQLDLEKL